jgi:hypothetical protein
MIYVRHGLDGRQDGRRWGIRLGDPAGGYILEAKGECIRIYYIQNIPNLAFFAGAMSHDTLLIL